MQCVLIEHDGVRLRSLPFVASLSRIRGRLPVRDWHIYLIRTRRGTLYTGVATDVSRRLDEHRACGKRGAKYLRSKGPLELVYEARLGSRGLALRAEHRVKRLSKRAKEALIAARPSRRKFLDMLGIRASR